MTGLMSLFERRMRRGLTILMYHRVLPIEDCRDYPLASLVIPDCAFRTQVEWLASQCQVLPVAEALAELVSGRSSKRPLLSVTFDDGYSDNYSVVAPILKEHGVRGTFYVTSDFVKNGAPLWFDQAAFAWEQLDPQDRIRMLNAVEGRDELAPSREARPTSINAWMAGLKALAGQQRIELILQAEESSNGSLDISRCRPMTPAEVIELDRDGHEIGSHSVTHPILPLLDDSDLAKELSESAAQLRAWIDKPVTGICFPNGDTDARVEHAVRAAGYRYSGFSNAGINLPDGSQTSLTRIAITMQRTVDHSGQLDRLGFRSEVCRFREQLRR
tara:strand:- start:8581 stop:9570 length:990 start_codon:yes stop_codon:yes gene_type:complete